MGRKYTKNWEHRMDDDDFCRQHGWLEKLLFLVLHKRDECTNAGLGRLTVRRWLVKLSPATEAQVWAALAALEVTGDIYADADTEEFLVREFMFSDEIGNRPFVLINAARSAAQVRSPKLAAVLLAELARVDVHRPADPKLCARLDAELMAAENHLRERAARLATPISDPDPEPDRAAPETVSERVSERVSDPTPETDSDRADSVVEPAFSKGSATPCVVVAIEVASSSVVDQFKEKEHLTRPVTCGGGRETSELPSVVSVIDDRAERPPAPPEHVPGPECATVPCGPCADTARATITDLATHTAERDGCGLCEHGYRLEPPELVALSLPAIRCDHTPLTLDDWRRRAIAPVAVRPGAWPSRNSRKTSTSTKWTRTHAAADHDVPGHRNDLAPLLAS
ncbi:hypothetical protein [Nocardia salmonicida]|uniref:hypothetical protein n=1 Tax=Nocardia salmonicida TaxID=53431 RepID=UPI002E29B1F4|nr:hypothetical protein [Nocardia salmonicida]